MVMDWVKKGFLFVAFLLTYFLVVRPIFVERKGQELGESLGGFLKSTSEGIYYTGWGVGEGFRAFASGITGGIQSFINLAKDISGWVLSPFTHKEAQAPSVYHQRLYPTSYNFRTVQILREGYTN